MTISLDKRTAAATVSLTKIANESAVDLGEDVCAQVDLAADRSYSAMSQWPDVYQEAIERALALTLTGLDDDGQVPFYIFDDILRHEDVLSEDNYKNYVSNISKSLGGFGGTSYAPALRRMLGIDPPAASVQVPPKRKRFGRQPALANAPQSAAVGVDLEAEKDAPPFFHIFCTDGAPSDRSAVERILTEARTRPHFFQFVAIDADASGKQFLEHLNSNLQGAGIDNVGVTVYEGFPPSGDDAAEQKFYDDVIREFFLSWLPQARKNGITRR